jgi:hypothetical protein
MIGIFDGDYASMTFGHADAAKGKAYDEAIINGVVTSPRVMRQMPRLLQPRKAEPCAASLVDYQLFDARSQTIHCKRLGQYRHSLL